MTEQSRCSGPLDGIRVLDFTALLQGPLATQVLADLGADVVKLEKLEGEWMRQWGIFASRTHGETDAFLAFNRNKRSVTIDLRNPGDLERVFELADIADVIVENFRPGVMDRLGLGYEALRKRNPRLIYAASSGYGRTGPYVSRPGQDYLVQALTGATWLTGRRSDPPFLMALAITDQYTALHLVVGILAALQHLNRTGKGQRMDVDLLSCMLALQQQELTVYLNHHNSFERAQENIGHPGITAPSGIYATQDGYMLLAMYPCPKLGGILGVDWLATYDTLEKMYEGRDTVHRLLEAHFSTQPTKYWIDLLSASDVWCAPIRSYADLEDDPQIVHKGSFWDVPYADSGKTYRTVGSPFSFSESPVTVRRGAPRAGQHTPEFQAREIWKD
jgi:crotonobetainyl-CoA:carnitine CoA-transferase CaiB-like acyl-CoA transferase